MSNKLNVRKLYDSIKGIPDNYGIFFKEYDHESDSIKIYTYNFFSFYKEENHYEFGGSGYIIKGYRNLLKPESEGIEYVTNEFTGEQNRVDTIESYHQDLEDIYYGEGRFSEMGIKTSEYYLYDDYMEREYRYDFDVKNLKSVLLKHYNDGNSHPVKLTTWLTPENIHSIEVDNKNKRVIMVSINEKMINRAIKERKEKGE